MNSCDRELPALRWRKSSYSGSGNSACVEVAPLDAGPVFVRDSKDPDGPVLEFGRDEWAAFIAGVRAGQFNLN